MGLFRQSGRKAGAQRQSAAHRGQSPGPVAGQGPAAARSSAAVGRHAPRYRFWLIVLAGVATFGAGGYLLAALVLFPAPLLPSERHVPRVLGLSESEARGEITRQHLQAEVAGSEPHPSADRGEVVWQDPPPGLVAPRGTTVSLVLSTGPRRVAVPDVSGFDEMFARRLVRAAGLTVEMVDSVLVKDVAAGVVVGSNPAAGESLLVGRSITLHLAR